MNMTRREALKLASVAVGMAATAHSFEAPRASLLGGPPFIISVPNELVDDPEFDLASLLGEEIYRLESSLPLRITKRFTPFPSCRHETSFLVEAA